MTNVVNNYKGHKVEEEKVLKLVEIFQGIMEEIQKVVLKKVNNNLTIG